MREQANWVDLQVPQAIERGEFDDLPGYGKPIEDLGSDPDPDWWVKKLVEREHITGVLPPALQVRKDDAELDDRLDRLTSEREVRRELEEFNERVRKARYQPLGGPPMITQERDVESRGGALARTRRRADAAQRPAGAAAEPAAPPPAATPDPDAAAHLGAGCRLSERR